MRVGVHRSGDGIQTCDLVRGLFVVGVVKVKLKGHTIYLKSCSAAAVRTGFIPLRTVYREL